MVLFRRNIPRDGEVDDLAATHALNADLHRAAGTARAPLWIAVDQEGGRVPRVREPATRWPPMFEIDRLPAEEAVTRARD